MSKHLRGNAPGEILVDISVGLHIVQIVLLVISVAVVDFIHRRIVM